MPRSLRGAARPASILMGLLLAVGAVAPAPLAHAQAAGTLDVTSVTGRTVDLVLALDPATVVDPSVPTSATVTVRGRVIPAESRLEVGADTRPTTAILVLDVSGSMAGRRVAAARDAAGDFVAAMPPDVRVGVVTFADAVRIGTVPTLDRTEAMRAIEAVRPSGDTSLYDAILRSVELAPAGSRIILLSDGKDTVSEASLATVTARLGAGGPPVDAVALSPTPVQREALRAIVDSSGGELRTAASSTDLTRTFSEASGAFGAKVRLRATIPDDIDASGQRVMANVAVGPRVVEASTVLPMRDSLARAVPTAPTQSAEAGPVEQSANPLVPLLLGIVIAVCIATVGLLAIRARHRQRTVARVEQVLRYRTGAERTSRLIAKEIAQRPTAFTWLDHLVARLPGAGRTRDSLSAAELPMNPTTWLALRVGAAALLALLLTLLLDRVLIALVVGAAVVWLAAWLFLRSRVGARQQSFANALPDFLMVLASGLRAGLSFSHALQAAADEDKGEVGRQIRRALREVQVGASLDDALMSCAQRMGNDDLRWTVTALGIQREVGGNLSSILDTAAATIKGRDELRREVRTLSAEGRLSAYILVALPLGVFAFLVIFRRPYISVLWTEPLGIALLIGLVLAMVVGWVWMRAIVRIRV